VLLLFFAVIVLVFPALAVWARRQYGGRGLALLTVITVSALVIGTLIAASEAAGNRLVGRHGYAYTATRTLLLAGLSLILPCLASAGSVWVAAPRVRPGWVYPIAVATALLGTVAGTIAAMYSLWSS
jgi:hypothetical protein